MSASAELGDRLGSFFRTRKGVAAAFLFGSHAADRAHRESDVDVAVLLDRAVFPRCEERFEFRVAVTSELIALLHHNEVDLVVLNDAPPVFARRIVLEGRRIHCSDHELEHAFRRDTMLRAPGGRPGSSPRS